MKKPTIISFLAGLAVGAAAVALILKEKSTPESHNAVVSDHGAQYLCNVEYADAHSGWVDVTYPDDPSRDIHMDFEGRLCPLDPSGRLLVDMDGDCVIDLPTGTEYDLVIDYYYEFSQAGRMLALETSDNVLKVYSTDSWEVIFEQKFVNHSGTIFINNDRHMLVCHYLDPDFETPQLVNVYDTSDWQLVNTIELDVWVEDLLYFSGTYVYDPVTDTRIDVLERGQMQ